MAVVVVLYIRNSRLQVDRLIDEANALVDEGDKQERELGPEANQLLVGAVPREFFVKRAEHETAAEDDVLDRTVPKGLVLDRARLEKSVAKTNELLTTIAKDFRAAAAKFDEGRQAGKSEVVSKYLELMSRAYQKRADAGEVRCKAVALLVDKSIKSEDELRKKFGALLSESRASEGEFERLDAEAQKLHEDNKKLFK